MICEGCTQAATNHASGLYIAGCEGCRARSLAIVPQADLENYFYSLDNGPEKRALRDAVLAERERISTLRAKAATLDPAMKVETVGRRVARPALLGGALPPTVASENRSGPASPDQGRSAGKARLLFPPGESTDG